MSTRREFITLLGGAAAARVSCTTSYPVTPGPHAEVAMARARARANAAKCRMVLAPLTQSSIIPYVGRGLGSLLRRSTRTRLGPTMWLRPSRRPQRVTERWHVNVSSPLIPAPPTAGFARNGQSPQTAVPDIREHLGQGGDYPSRAARADFGRTAPPIYPRVNLRQGQGVPRLPHRRSGRE